MASSLKLSTKLILGFLISSMITLIVGIIGALLVARAQSNEMELLKNSEAQVELVNLSRQAQVTFKIQVQEWKNILLRGNDLANFQKHQRAFITESDKTQGILKKVQSLMVAYGMETRLVDRALQTHDELRQKYLAALAQYDSSKIESAQVVDKLVKGIDRAPTEAIDEIILQLNQTVDERQKKLAESIRNESSIGSTLIYGTITLGFVLSLGMGFLLSSHINKLLGSITQMLDNTSKRTANAARQVATSSNEQADQNSKQATSLEEISSSTSEIMSMAEKNADAAKNVESKIQQVAEKAEHGAESVKMLRERLHQVQIDSSKLQEAMDGIKSSGSSISSVLKTINEIAFQTNLLALNAAVEAARAGEAGMGFAVVADEVRNLARRSADAANQTSSMIQLSIEKSQHGIENSTVVTSSIDEIFREVQTITGELEEIAACVRQVRDSVGEISAASLEQSQGIVQINSGIAQIDESTQISVRNSDQTASAAVTLEDQAGELQSMIDELYRVVNGELSVAPKQAFQKPRDERNVERRKGVRELALK